MTTITAVKRALEETLVIGVFELSDNEILTLQAVANSPTLLTLIANRLSDRGRAGNAMSLVHLAVLGRALNNAKLYGVGDLYAALEWAIDQLTPPEPALKATDSPALYLQQIGRVDRVTGKIKPYEPKP